MIKGKNVTSNTPHQSITNWY